jgi:hypothetical protein
MLGLVEDDLLDAMGADAPKWREHPAPVRQEASGTLALLPKNENPDTTSRLRNISKLNASALPRPGPR